ncbi:uncharacterized protein LOC132257386 [Phlebotomus argentipes]|uniref:uncharacterized protein LOC132257386 n=1 Tax=Phlebotomus argentipes TaxID=94469 RepID=UPI00289350F0|nr:uncharacterized protein LOC132257386 [Phlebotomus argentipes]
MERFTVKIINKPKSALRNVCRLCGMDNPSKISILQGDNVFCVDDVPLATKISVCCGIQVTNGDKMPQKICTLCSDKINDFFEFREMCSATQIQTRDLLGLPREMPKPTPVPLHPSPLVSLQNHIDHFDRPSDTILEPPIISESRTIQRAERRVPAQGRVQKKKKKTAAKSVVVKPEPSTSEPASTVKKKVKKAQVREKKKTKPAVSKKVSFAIPSVAEKRPSQEEMEPKSRAKKAKVEKPVKVPKPPVMIVCPICGDSMEKEIRNAHMLLMHSPKTFEFGCSACAVPFETREDLQDHQSWHKQANIPYRCFKCQGSFDRLSAYTVHSAKSCSGNIEFSNTVPNTKCTMCNQDFATFNLYNWHGCFIKANSNCPKCDKFIQRKQNLFKHIFNCTGKGNFNATEPPEDEEMAEMPHIKVENLPVAERKVKPLKIRIFDKKKHAIAETVPVRKVIKSEPDSTLEIEESQVNIEAPSLTTTIEDIQPPSVDKKKTLKNPYAAILRKIKQEPKDTTESTPPIAKIGIQKVLERVTPAKSAVRVKPEPLDTGYEAMVRITAANIKKERLEPTDGHPVSGLYEEVAQEKRKELPTLPKGVRIKQEKDVFVKPEPIDPAYDKHLPNPVASAQKVVKKHLFKIPSALIKKIKQEKSQREAESQKGKEPNDSHAQQDSVPVITGVRSIEQSDFRTPMSCPIRIKTERLSPPRSEEHEENCTQEENGVNAKNGNHEVSASAPAMPTEDVNSVSGIVVNTDDVPDVPKSAPETTAIHQNGR